MSTIKVRGTRAQEIPNTVSPAMRTGTELDGMTVKSKGAVWTAGLRAAVQEEFPIENVDEDDVLAMEIEGGLQLWTRFDDFKRDFPGSAARALTGNDDFELNPNLGLPETQRFAGTLLMKGLEVLGVQVDKGVVLRFAHKVEEQLRLGLHRLTGDPQVALSKNPDADFGNQVALIFIHGTGSSTEGSYQILWEDPDTPGAQTDFWSQIRNKYRNNIFAFEHRSLTESPVKNAIDLLNVLPENAAVHLVTHSRGGLIGELLCAGQTVDGADPFDINLINRMFADGESKRQVGRDELTRLNDLLKQKKIKVERFVRVACPARGTTLVSRRLDRWLSMLTSALSKIPVTPAIKAVSDVLKDLLVAIVKTKADPSILPGLEAMMPDSPLIRLLNSTTRKSAADLSVLSGDLTSDGFIKSLALGPVGRFYGGAHDLVVNTASMDGGLEREQARIFVHDGAAVTHFRYFTNSATRNLILAGLRREDKSDGGYVKLERKEVEIPSRALRGPEGPRPVVFLIPGFMGTQLNSGGRRIWLDLAGLESAGFRGLAIKQEAKPEAALTDIYEPLVSYLSDSHEVITFGYDWRLSMQTESKRLERAIGKALDSAERSGQPVSIVAHGIGGLLIRVAMDLFPNAWTRMKKSRGRILYLGSPMGGTYEFARMLTGDSRLTQFLELLAGPDIRGTLASFPGLLEALPPALMVPGGWNKLPQATLPKEVDLAAAAQTRTLMDRVPADRETERYIAGFAPLTPAGIGPYVREFWPSAQGDGLAPWITAIPTGIPVYYTETLSGDLARDPTNFAGILDVLQSGTTKRLAGQAPPASREAAALGTLPPDLVDTFPDERSLAAAALLGSLAEYQAASAARISVKLAHGNIAFAKHPVMVGHYVGDPLMGTEAVLDANAGRRMGQRSAVGLYPGEIGTSAVFLESRPGADSPSGAVVVGLGAVGDLKSQSLERAVTHGVLEYALTLVEHLPRTDESQGPVYAKLSSLLIGTLGGGISTEESVASILRGTIAANAKLKQAGCCGVPVQIRELELIELWEDRAIQAARALQRLKEAPDLQVHMEIETREVQQRPGGLRGIAPDDHAGWWSRLRISAQQEMEGAAAPPRSTAIRFGVITNRARTEVEIVPSERLLLDRLLRRISASAVPDRKTAKALFEIMVPNRLKELAPDLGRTVVVLDDETAQYPWELLENGLAPGREPMSVQSGFIRQLETQRFREIVIQAQERSALVVGDPLTTKFVRLPGAQTEASEVVRVLGLQNFDVVSEIGSDAVSILNSLYAQSYRILHLAGHGVHRYELTAGNECVPAETVSGMLIGDEEFLTAAFIKQMRRVPELVFINCCHLGRMDGSEPEKMLREKRYQLAANLAVQFIDIGVKAVIAAGWVVDDAAAKTFAGCFYQSFLSGETFGEAIIDARRAAYYQHAGVNTWGAYQCYGDPGFRLRLGSGESSENIGSQTIFTPEQFAVEIDNLAREAFAGWKLEEIPKRLAKVLKAGQPDWLKRADVSYALGKVYGELGVYEEAVKCYENAGCQDKAEGAVKGLEQAENLRARGAIQRWQEGLLSKQEALARIDRAVQTLKTLLTFGESAERFGLLASAWKRRALVTDGDERKKSLNAMMEGYKRMLDRKPGSGTYSSTGLNWLLSEIVLAWFDPSQTSSLEKYRPAILADMAGASTKDPDFWNMVLAPDCKLVLYLAEASPTDSALREMAQAYKSVFERVGSEREKRSVLEHLEFLVAMADSRPIADHLRQCVEYLESRSDVWPDRRS